MTMQERVAIVTGAARGIGAATAAVLAQQGAAAVLVDIDLPQAEEAAAVIQAQGGRAHAFQCDVSQPAAVEALVAAVVAQFGRVDILVNNAGICPRIPLEEMTEEWFDRIININLKSVFFLSRAAAEDMKKRQWGRIVNISSTSGRVGGVFRATVYSATKGGVLAMTKSMARHYAGDNILINAIAPGATDTRMFDIDAEARDTYIDTVPLKRLAAPEEIARSIAHLCSEETTWVTGATLDVNGGVVMV
ncbi:MAG: 3-oxoacyl-[acyl-carrier-protein] reductase [Anaerolineae bacterium]